MSVEDLKPGTEVSAQDVQTSYEKKSNGIHKVPHVSSCESIRQEEVEEEVEEEGEGEKADVTGYELRSLSALVAYMELKLRSAAEVKNELQVALMSTDRLGALKELGRKHCPTTLVGGL
eukprot:8698534-Pyramimonas_sp.AAC.1